MSRELVKALVALRQSIDNNANARRDTKLAVLRGEGGAPTANLRSLQMGADTLQLVQAIQAAAAYDVQVFKPVVEFGLPDVTPQQVSSPGGLAAPSGGVAMPNLAQGHPSYVAGTLAHIMPVLQPLPQPTDMPANLPPASRHMLALFVDEIRQVSDAAGTVSGAVGGAFLPKLKNALSAFQTQRYGDVQTILKSALRNEPHNPVLLFLLTQFLYFMVSNGHKEVLPEARDNAQKAMNFNDKVTPEKLLFYRYYCVAGEMLHDPARALGWMREHGLLHVTPMKTAGGLGAHNGLLVKAWAMLAQTDVELWSELEFNQLYELALDVVGGGFLFVALFRTKMMDAAMTRKEPFPRLQEIDIALAQAFQNYQTLAPHLDKVQETTSAMPWLVRQHYFTLIGRAGPKPLFDHVLLHIALNGAHWGQGYPDNELRSGLGDPHASYWRLWALSVCPGGEVHAGQPLDATEAVEDKMLIPACEQALALLRAAENALIKHEIWEDLKPWLIRWQMDHVLAAGTGNSHPREGFMPKQPMLRALYRKWSQPQPTGLLASELIHASAQRGAFASMGEVLAAFEGAVRLIDDPNHGLVATQKRALAAAKQQNPAKFGGMSVGGEGLGAGQVMTLLVPIMLLGGMVGVITLSKNMGQAIGLSLALAGFAGVALLGTAKK